MRLRSSLVGRIAVLSALWAALLLIGGAVALATLYRSSVMQAVDDRLDDALRELFVALEPGANGGARLVGPTPIGLYDQAFSGRYWLVTRVDQCDTSEEVGRSRSIFDGVLVMDDDLCTRLDVAEAGATLTVGGVGPVDEPLRARAQLVFFDENQDRYILLAATDRQPIDADVRRFRWAAIWVLGAFALAVCIGVIAQIRLGLAPVFRMRDAVAKVRSGDTARMSEDAPTELAPLVSELNALLDHNRNVVERARAHVGNLAHALKTPISVLLNESRRADGPLAEIVQRHTHAMAEHVEHHLKRASAAANAEAVGARADVMSVLDDLARTMPRMHPDRDVALDVRGHAGLTFRGERQDLVEMIGNLLDNAYKWAHRRVDIVAEPQDATGRLRIVIHDDGPGLPPEKRKDVLRRGARLDEATPGSGLGLSIVDDLAHAYGGQLLLEESPYQGLCVVLELPAAPRG